MKRQNYTKSAAESLYFCGIEAKPNYRSGSQIISILFYPGFLALLGAFLLAGPSVYPNILLSFLFWVLLPVICVFILKKYKLVDDIFLKHRSQRTRIYILSAFCAGMLILLEKSTTPLELGWKLSIFFVLLILGLINVSMFKISAHGAGSGGFLALSIYLSLNMGMPYTVGLGIAITVMVYYARFSLSAHSHFELITGILLGFFTTFAFILWT